MLYLFSLSDPQRYATGTKEHEIHKDVHFCLENKETLENKGKTAKSGLQHDSSQFILLY
jgi:hypothetical protein